MVPGIKFGSHKTMWLDIVLRDIKNNSRKNINHTDAASADAAAATATADDDDEDDDADDREGYYKGYYKGNTYIQYIIVHVPYTIGSSSNS